MTKENKKNDDLVVVESRWKFLRETTPDFLKDPLGMVVNFIEKLPFLTEDQKKVFLERIKSLREGGQKE